MLKITVPAMEYYDEVSNEFILFKEQSLQLEHSSLHFKMGSQMA